MSLSQFHAPSRSLVMALAAFSTVSCQSDEAEPEAQSKAKAPIVLIVVDTLRADHLKQYGYDRETSPGLDAFAGEATRFSQCVSTAAWTTPSTASIMTGLLPHRHGAYSRGSALSDKAQTLAELLREGGWSTAGISYNHNISRTTGFDQGFHIFEGYQGKSGEYPDITRMIASANDLLEVVTHPFFLYIQPMNVHGPYRTPDDHRSGLLGHEPGAEFRYSKSTMKSIMKKGKFELRETMDPAYLQSHRDQYDTAIRYSTDRLFEFFEQLRESGVYDKSWIVLTGDHGEELYDHRGFGHGYTLYQEQLHVPLWIKRPYQSQPAVVEERVSLVDLLPTLLEGVGEEVPDSIDGVSLLPLLDDDPTDISDRALLFENRWPGRCEGEGLIAGPWKLIRLQSNYEGREDVDLLFDLNADPNEQQDLAQEHPDIARQLSVNLKKRLEDTATALDSKLVLDQMNKELLEALGYAK